MRSVGPADPPSPPVLSRRALLAAAAAAAAACLTGCANRPRGAAHAATTPTAAPQTLTVLDDALYKAKDPLTAAWQRTHPRVTLSIRPSFSGIRTAKGTRTDADSMQRAGDILAIGGDGAVMGGSGDWPDLSSLLKQQNFNPALLPPSALAAFTGSTRRWGLPIRIVPFAMTVDQPAITKLGVAPAPGEPWTWQHLQDAVATAANAVKGTPSGPLVSGTGWADIRLFGGFIVGLGGTLTQAGALALDSPPAVTAAKTLLHFAQASGWPALTGYRNPAAPEPPTPSAGPTADNTRGAPLFIIEPLLSDSYVMPKAVRFPVLPQQSLIPVSQIDGLGLSHYCLHPETAVDFLLWLYAPAQQTALIGAGIPPVVLDPSLQTAWSTAVSAHPTQLAPYDPAHTVDVAALLPPLAGGTADNYTRLMGPWMQDAVAHPDRLQQDLTAAQQAVQKIVSRSPSAAGTICDPTDTLCNAPGPP